MAGAVSTPCFQYKVKNTFIEVDVFEDAFLNELAGRAQRQVSEPAPLINTLLDDLLSTKIQASKHDDIWTGKCLEDSGAHDVAKQAELSEPEKEPDLKHVGTEIKSNADSHDSRLEAMRTAREISDYQQSRSERRVLSLSLAFTNGDARSNLQSSHHGVLAAPSMSKKSRRRKRDSLIDQAAKHHNAEVRPDEQKVSMRPNPVIANIIPNVGMQGNVRRSPGSLSCPRCGGACESGQKFCKFCGYAVLNPR
jgi:hypothetical protein